MSTELFSLKGRTALVTGSSRGLGRAMAEGLAAAGAAIVLNGSDAGRLSAAAAEMKAAGLRGPRGALRRDRRSRGHRGLRALDAEGIAIDILVNNAGHPAAQADGRACDRRVAQGHRRQSHQRLRHRAGGGEAHDPARPRQDHQHRLADERARPRHRRALHGRQGRHQDADPRHGGRMGRARHPGQRHRARLHADRHEPGPDRQRRPSTPGSRGARRRGAGASPRSSSARQCFSPRRRPTTSTARSSMSTAACWPCSEGANPAVH